MTVRLISLIVTAAMAALLTSTLAKAEEWSYSSNAVDHCQAFTPGISNTIRNRVVGSENIGSPIAVACAFQSLNSMNSSDPTRVVMYFSNNSGVTFDINCTMLTSSQSSPSSYAVSKAVTVPAGSASTESISFSASDNPVPGAFTLGSRLIGVNCLLPTGAVINETRLFWEQSGGYEPPYP